MKEVGSKLGSHLLPRFERCGRSCNVNEGYFIMEKGVKWILPKKA
jgi:hypothetical protein